MAKWLETHLIPSLFPLPSGVIKHFLENPLSMEMFIGNSHTLRIQTMAEKVLNPPKYSKLYSKHFLTRYNWIPRDIFLWSMRHVPSFAPAISVGTTGLSPAPRGLRWLAPEAPGRPGAPPVAGDPII